jgi:hypothetical protein
MCRLQKLAWYQLIVLVLWILIMAVSAAAIYYLKLNGELITIPLLFGIIIRFDRAFFPLRPGKIEYDERDAAIQQRSMKIAYAIFSYAFFFGLLTAYLILGSRSSIPTSALVVMILGGAILIRLAWSIAVIVQYGIFSKKELPETVAQ